ncbi:MAG: phosphoglucosamine mutase [Actinobacteria bacterium]|nr:phosphoglucosamine mutase [Actinomycetota bacterium]NDC46189.1 phosphoglucosamine mutase [Actinomycetota bacterium]NDE66780.1 phosphoglucosamine mutase [Actinomycetota bacterium]
MALRFGTDGVRGRVDTDIRAADVARLGACVSRQWPHSPIIIGHDGRESGTSWLAAFAAGARSQGSVVHELGVVPTPALAFLSAQHHCVAVSITASHNPYHDNGVKVFAPGGTKLSDDEQGRIERLWQASGDVAPAVGAQAVDAPPASQGPSVDDYVNHFAKVVTLDRQRVVLDCANGAMSHVAPRVLAALGLAAEVLNAAPDGRNINDRCGAVHPQPLAQRCAQLGCIGLAFDGDGDRVIAVDEQGNIVDGDRVIALAALDLQRRGLLHANTVVVTSMSNLGFHRAMREAGVTVVTTDVGDRSVLSAMSDGNYSLGGEQSGHIIFSQHATTGDGLLAGLTLLEIVRRSGESLHSLATNVMQSVPQILRNVRVARMPNDIEDLLGEELRSERAALGDDGRILVRASGTEPVVRVMVEAVSQERAEATAARLVRLVETRTSVV